MSDTPLHSHTASFDPTQRQGTAAYVGGALGIAACLLGLAIFVFACFGFEASLKFSLLPLILGSVGLILTVVGALIRHTGVEETHILAALFINVFAIVGALLEVAAWQRWTILH